MAKYRLVIGAAWLPPAQARTTIAQDRAVVVVEHDLDPLASISQHMWAIQAS